MKLIFLHGLPLDGSIWRPQLDAFPGALAPDLPGCGSRQLEGKAELGALEAVVAGAHLIGHSFGAAVAVDLALRRPDAPCSLTLVNPLLLGRSSNVAAWSTSVGRAKAGDLEGARDAWAACPLFDGAREPVREILSRYRGAHWTGQVQTAFRVTDPAPQLKRLTLPVLVVTSTRDQPAFRAMAREYRDALPQARFEELDAGHMAPAERPDAFNALLRNFLRQPLG
ncbi:MAG TPA: alpha/beta hydrolase [Polyangiaceae bacterium]